ncbi:hypothetical protein PFISCL1PPCAC_204, partial [Pristionchus fissidentatus]
YQVIMATVDPVVDDQSSSSEDEVLQIKALTKKQIQEINRRKNKNKKKKASKRNTKGGKGEEEDSADSGVATTDGDSGKETEKEEGAEKKDGEEKEVEPRDEDVLADFDIEYVGEKPKIQDPSFYQFAAVFDKFVITPESLIKKTEEQLKADHPTESKGGSRNDDERVREREEILKSEMKTEESKLSKKKLRLSMQPSMAKLKESTGRPDVVEWADVTSRDPFMLVALKAYRNTVPVPRHWNAKRKYLAGKRGFERPPFDLPDFVKRTGIQEMRESLWEKEDHQSLKSKMRERARPKLGKIDIDYQKLHDAFFKWQTKPEMTLMGELYFEGKELEGRMRDKKPGQLSDELRIALGMPVGHNATKFPPPWLIAMQRYGPPPSYPTLKIAGLNSPIPDGCSFGYHAGGWGKPPVDQYGKPLYGDVFGVNLMPEADEDEEQRLNTRYWGEIGSDDDSSDESEAEEDEEGEDGEKPDMDGMQTPMTDGFATPSGMSSAVPTGLDTPDTIELRKGKRGDESSLGGDTPAVAYHIIPEKRVDRIGGQMMGSTHVYDLSKKQAMNESGVEVNLNPEDLDGLDQRGLEAKYEEQLRKQQKSKDDDEGDGEDFSDMVAEHNAKQGRKRKAQEQKKSSTSGGSGASQNKKYKDFKF